MAVPVRHCGGYIGGMNMTIVLFWFYLVRVLVVLIGLTFVMDSWSWWAVLIVPAVILLADTVHHILWDWQKDINDARRKRHAQTHRKQL